MNWKHTLFVALLVVSLAIPATGPALAQEGDGPTITDDAVDANVDVYQPRYVSEPVQQVTDNGSRVYVARGEYLELKPQNFNQANVTAYTVQEEAATMTYDRSIGRYVLNTQGNTGTFHLYWTVQTGNSTTTTFTAAIRVQEANYAHVPQSEYQNLQNRLDEWSGLIQSIQESGDPDKSLEQKVEFGNQARDFTNNPFSALSGQFLALQTLRFFTPAGWLDLGIIIALVYGLTRGLYGSLARLRKQLEKEEEISRREDEQYLKQFKQILAGTPVTDVDGIDDHQAAVIEERLGTNLFTALRNFWNTFGADNLKRMYVGGMGAIGYRAHVTRSGGEPDVEIIPPEDDRPVTDGGDAEGSVMPLDSVGEDVVDAITWEQVDKRVFEKDPDISAVDQLMVTNRERDGDLIADLSISIPEDFQSRKAFMEAIGQFIREVQETEFTDDDGYPREDRTVLNHLMAFTTVMEDEYDVPLDLWWRACIWNAEGLNRDDEAREVLDDLTDAGEVDVDAD